MDLLAELKKGPLSGEGSLSRAGVESRKVRYEIWQSSPTARIRGSLTPLRRGALSGFPYEISILTLRDGRRLSVSVTTIPTSSSVTPHSFEIEGFRFLEPLDGPEGQSGSPA